MKKGKVPWKWISLLIPALFIKWFSTQHSLVEEYYSNGFYPPLGRALRIVFGWMPFSVGDIIYTALPLTVIIWFFRWTRKLVRKQAPRKWGWLALRQAAFFSLCIYVAFYTLWGLNYSRLGVRDVLNLDVKAYETGELMVVMDRITEKLNREAGVVQEAHRDSIHKMKFMRQEVMKAYASLAKEQPAFNFQTHSMKRSVFGRVGNYTGFSGYLNPFTGEAQLNRTIPWFYQPAVSCHEVAHQIGFSSEAEANFVGYLASKSSPSHLFRYSTYYDMFFYGMRELRKRDSTLVSSYIDKLHPRVLQDREDYRRFLADHRSVVEPMVDSFYDAYLRANEQVSGISSYNEVVGLLMAWYRKYGLKAL